MRDRSYEISMLQDTLEIFEQGYYIKNGKRIGTGMTRQELEKTLVYLPDDVKKAGNDPAFEIPYVIGGRTQHECLNTDSFSMAIEIANSGIKTGSGNNRVLVLNFANPVNPGGGVRGGARAQEEDLCRKSSLLLSLESRDAEQYYGYNRKLHTFMGSDALMITPNVVIIKNAAGELLDEPVTVSVLTCAAPVASHGTEGLTQGQYEKLLYDRINGMLKCSARLGYKEVVLGAWGCGAFGNDARVMSDVFFRVLKEIRYNGHGESDLFDGVYFAVLDRTPDKYNYKEFDRNFSSEAFYAEETRLGNEEVSERIRRKEANLDRIRGCLAGGAAGDALGYPVEFLTIGQIYTKYGFEGITSYDTDGMTGKALISDDTQMTLFTANGILVGETRRKLRSIGAWPRCYVSFSYNDWLVTQTETFEEHLANDSEECDSSKSWLSDVPELYARRAPGNTCLSGIEARKGRYIPDQNYISNPVNSSKGCGGIMRIAPVGLAYDGIDIKTIDMEAAQIAAITHGHSLGYMPAAVLAHIINRIVFGSRVMSLKEIILDAEKTVSEIFDGDAHLNDLTGLIDLAVELSENGDTDTANIRRLGEGWVAEETLAISVYCSLRHQNSFSDGITAAVNHSGDSDSTGSVTGNILGALLGYSAIDEKWKKDLELIDVILEISDDLCRGCQMEEYSSYRDPDWERKYIK